MNITNLKLKSHKSFSRTDPCDLFKTLDYSDDVQNIMNICKTCKKQINGSNDYCSLQCYKNSKKDNRGFYNIECMNCKNIFQTKCIFTDFCSNYCFNKFKQTKNKI